MFARHGFPFNLLISVLVSMTTLFSAMFSDFYAREPKAVDGCAFEKVSFSAVLLSVGISFH